MSITKTFYVTSNTGTPLTGKSLILKDRAGTLPDIPATELGLGHYSAFLDEGTAWNVYEGATPIGVVLDALLAQTREPAIGAGNPAHAWFGNKVFRALAESDVSGLSADLLYLANTDIAIIQRIVALEGQVGTPSAPAPRTFDFNGKTYSMDPITVLQQSGLLDQAGNKWFWQLGPSAGGTPFTVVVPADGSWVDAFRLTIPAEYDYFDLKSHFTPPGLLDNLEIVLLIQAANKQYLPYLDFRYSILESPVGTSDSGAPFVQIGDSVIAKQLAYTDTGVGGADGYVAHSVRGLGAQMTLCGGFLKLKIEARLKTPASAISMVFYGPENAHVVGQLYPEVLP